MSLNDALNVVAFSFAIVLFAFLMPLLPHANGRRPFILRDMAMLVILVVAAVDPFVDFLDLPRPTPRIAMTVLIGLTYAWILWSEDGHER